MTGYDKARHTTYKTVSAALAYDDPFSGEVIILMIHQAILVPQIRHNLLCPMQLRINDVEVDEKPKFLHSMPTENSHAMVITEDDET